MATSAASRIDVAAIIRAFMNASCRRPLRGTRPANKYVGRDPRSGPATTLLAKNIRDRGREIVLRLVPALLEVLLPVLRPRPSVVIDEPRIGGGRLLGAAVGIEDVAQALDERVAAGRGVPGGGAAGKGRSPGRGG